MDTHMAQQDRSHWSAQDYADDLNRVARDVGQGTSSWFQHAPLAAAAVQVFEIDSSLESFSPQQMRGGLQSLQQIALHCSSVESMTRVAEWCASQWMHVLEHDQQDVDALYGVAISWLFKAQPSLHKIYELDKSSSDSSGSLGTAPHLPGDLIELPEIDDEVEARRSSAEFVEARTFLQPATEYFDQAIRFATQENVLTGEMFMRAAEAYISLGNTSSTRSNRQYFRKAVRLLQQALNAGFPLTASLQQFFDDYKRFTD